MALTLTVAVSVLIIAPALNVINPAALIVALVIPVWLTIEKLVTLLVTLVVPLNTNRLQFNVVKSPVTVPLSSADTAVTSLVRYPVRALSPSRTLYTLVLSVYVVADASVASMV